jgi:KUP system potassium uptake protein
MVLAITTPVVPAAVRVSPRATSVAALAALGIVYGDLGTSPLYTLQTVVGAAGGQVNPAAAMGILSLVFWALTITVSVKYCVFVLRADNHGEGGILALMALIGVNRSKRGRLLVAMGLFGAALIYGDGIITPAISVLSALEGVNIATDALKPYVMPMAVAILLGLFSLQTFGTARIGKVFGPVMLLWFIVIAILGVSGVAQRPEVLASVNPMYAVAFLARRGWSSFVVLGGVFLAITGGEALYADMGHIGRNPIRSSWYCVVLPALLLNYAGQTALLYDQTTIGENPFFKLAPHWLVYPLVILATIATIIASQAIITGSFSLTRQAMQLGWLPGLHIRQTSDKEYGQIYVPFVNWMMMALTIALTIGFGSSDRLAGAYGTAVSTTMLITTCLLYNAMRDRWGWSIPLALLTAGLFMAVDLAFFSANLLKIAAGGWLPLLFGATIFIIMTTWRRGIEAMQDPPSALTENPAWLIELLACGSIPRVPGTAVFLSRTATPVSFLMLRHIKQIGALHALIVSLTVKFEQVPWVPLSERVEIERIAEGFWHVTVRYGFVEIPNLPAALASAKDRGCPVDLDDAVYFGAHDEVVRSATDCRLSPWRRILFGFMHRNGVRTVDRFNLPAKQFLDIGGQVEL